MPGRPALLVIQMRDAVDVDQKSPLTKTLPELRSQLNRLSNGSYRILRKASARWREWTPKKCCSN